MSALAPIRNRRRIACVIGTRPEVIKMAPVVWELKKRCGQLETKIIATAQHREMLDEMMQTFDLCADIDLDLMECDQSPARLLSKAVAEMDKALQELKPDLVVVQGDTTTVLAVSLVAFLNKLSVGHVEAGLRSFDNYNPFPEEVNRRVASIVTNYHFAPTERAKSNLLKEGVPEKNIYVTGNTVVDALLAMREKAVSARPPGVESVDFERRKVILLTAHRRENHGEPLLHICQAVRKLVERNTQIEVIYPVHPNPNVTTPVRETLGNHPRIHLIPPVSYLGIVNLMSHCYLILTDSGGIQEEAPSMNKPVLVLRDVTERPEAIEAGVARLVGTETDTIVREAERLLSDPQEHSRIARCVNPYGDGRASIRIADVLQSKVADLESR